MPATTPFVFLRALDLPAREALLLSRGPIWRTGSIMLFGSAAVSLAWLCCATLGADQLLNPAALRWDRLRAFFEAIAIAAPSTLVFSLYIRLQPAPRVLVAALAISLMIAGVVTLCATPLVGFLVLVAQAHSFFFLHTLLPLGALMALAAIHTRIITAIDSSKRANHYSIAFNLTLMAVFLGRIL